MSSWAEDELGASKSELSSSPQAQINSGNTRNAERKAFSKGWSKWRMELPLITLKTRFPGRNLDNFFYGSSGTRRYSASHR
jgi:hypothetical protein